MTYLWVLVFILLGSTWLEFALHTRVLLRWRRLLASLALASAPFLLWDAAAIATRQWWFDPGQLTGIALPGGMPLEEVLFFPIVGLAAVLTLEAVRSVRGSPTEGKAGP